MLILFIPQIYLVLLLFDIEKCIYVASEHVKWIEKSTLLLPSDINKETKTNLVKSILTFIIQNIIHLVRGKTNTQKWYKNTLRKAANTMHRRNNIKEKL